MWFYSFSPYIPTTRGKSLNSSTTTTTTKVKVQQKRKPVLHLEADDVGLEDFGEVIWDGGVAGARILESGVQTIHIPAHNPHCDALSLSPRPSLQFQWTLLFSLVCVRVCSKLLETVSQYGISIAAWHRKWRELQQATMSRDYAYVCIIGIFADCVV